MINLAMLLKTRLRTFFTLFLVLLVAFFLTRVAYQDPAVMLAPRNATPEAIEATGLELAAVIGGAIVTEKMFGLDGVGRLAIDAALEGDFPVVIGTTIFAARAFIFCNFLTDMIHHLFLRTEP